MEDRVPRPCPWSRQPAASDVEARKIQAERPRERLAARGVASLTDAELVAVVIGTGAPGAGSLEVARALLASVGGVAGVMRASPATMASMRGVGAGKAARLSAGAEIARRALRAELARGDALTSPAAVRDYLKLALGPETVEVFVGLFLDSQHRLIAAEELARGTLAQTSVYPREVVKTALRREAAAVIFAHNHPSGVAEPSRADEILTQALKNALTLVDVRTLDHLIVAGARVTSFAERGLL
jgi:DNA repair protein RadC